MTSFYYHDQNPSGFCFLVQIRAFVIQTSQGLPNFNMKVKTERILVIVVKWSHRANLAFRGRVSIVEIFLDHNNLSWQRRQCPTMGEKFGLTFCSWLQSCPGKPYMWIFCLFFPYGELLRSENFSTMVTRRNGFSSLLFIPRLTYNLKLSKKVKNYQRMP